MQSSKTVRVTRKSVLALVLCGAGLGVALLFGVNWLAAATSSEEFCLSCHEMRDTPFAELRESRHYTNARGIQVTCPDCHIPVDFVPRMQRKVEALGELYVSLVGHADSEEKFAERRADMETRVWARMRADDSLNCRSCHQAVLINVDIQRAQASKAHKRSVVEALTCIDCHQGIAHHNAHIEGDEDDALDMFSFD